MEQEVKSYSVYIRTDESNRITAINSSAFLHDTEGWTLIDQGHGDRYAHAQGNYLSKAIMDDKGIYRYKLVDGVVTERTAAEMYEDYTPPEQPEDLAAEVAELRESNAQLQEALELLLSGEVE